MAEAVFWSSTPFQARLFIEAANDRNSLATKRAMWAAWHGAAFGRVKKMPSLDDALRGVDGKKRKAMTPDEILQAFEMINIRSGGKDMRETKH